METKWLSAFRIVYQRLMYMIQLAAYCNIKAIIKVKKKKYPHSQSQSSSELWPFYNNQLYFSAAQQDGS